MDMDEARLQVCKAIGHISHVDGAWKCDSCGATGSTENICHVEGCAIDAAIEEMCTRMYEAGAMPITDIGINAKLKLGSLLDEDQHRFITNITNSMVATPTPEGRKKIIESLRTSLPNLDRVTLSRTANSGLGTPQAIDAFRTMLMAAVVDMMRGR